MRCLAILAASLLSLVNARVTFEYSEVLQAPDLIPKANFKCKNACRVYVDQPSANLIITVANGDVIATFAEIVADNKFVPAGLLLRPRDDYFVENRGEINPHFVMYIVDSAAPNFGASVYVPQDTIGIAVKDKARFVTILSSLEAIWFSGFSGVFPAGYPRIYATGYDSAVGQCRPVYQARSQHNAASSWPTIASAMFTIDFGFSGAHNVSVNSGKINKMTKNGGMTTVYTSPGYVGCPMNMGQSYYSKLINVQDTFTLESNSLDITASYDFLATNEPVYLRVAPYILDFVGSDSFEQSYSKGTFAVEVAWNRMTPGASWALQLDFGTVFDTVETTTIDSSSSQWITEEITSPSPLATSAPTDSTTGRSTSVSDFSTTSTSGRTAPLFTGTLALFVIALL